MSFDLKPLGKFFGASIEGIDFSKSIKAVDQENLRETWLKNGVISFRNQKLSEREFVDFSRIFGPLEPHLLSEYHHPKFPEILLLATVRKAGEPRGLADAGSYWHSDLSYKAKPSRASALYAIEVPKFGGDTLFCDMVSAYTSLPLNLRVRIEKLEAIHSYEYRTNIQVQKLGLRKPLSPLEKEASPDVKHPVVRFQPETGRRALFVNPGFTNRICGVPKPESDRLLEFLFKHCQREEFQMRYRWKIGDLLVWDNSVVMHCATVTDLPMGTRRSMWRSVISGNKPLGPGI